MVNIVCCRRNLKCTNKDGFTLVELLVVISIIALLLSILMPSLRKARDQARKIVCASNLHTMSIAVLTYNVEYRDYPAITWDSSGVGDGTYYWTERLIKAGLIEGYLDRRSKNYYIEAKQYNAYTCPTYRQMSGIDYIWTSLSYGYNDIYLSPSLGATTTARNKNYLGNTVSRPVITLMESDHLFIGYDYAFPNNLVGNPVTGTAKTIPKRHDGGLNSAWVDGHVEFKKVSDYKPVMINSKTIAR